MTAENLLSWDKQIPKVLLGYRLDAQASTKFSPFFLLHARPMVLPLVHRHRANLLPLYDEVPTDSEVAKQAERLTASKAEARASILQGQEKQKPSYARRQMHGSLGKENPTELGTLPFRGLTVAQYLGLPARETELPPAAPSTTTNPVPEATVPKLRAEQAAATTVRTLTILNPTVSKGSPAVIAPATTAGPNTAATTAAHPVTEEATPTVRAAEHNAAGKRRWHPKVIQEGDFVVIKIHQMVRKDGERKGKLGPKAEGPYLVSEFTDDSKNIAVIEDAN